MLEVFDRKTRRKTAILQNAHSIKESKEINVLHYLEFSLPYNDPKNEYCQPFHYVRYNDGELYRIMDDGVKKSETGDLVYTCEHVLATLLDKVLFGYHIVGNLGVYTKDSIQYILNHQDERNWVLGDCDFRHQFEYGWEQENLLGALFSIPQGFADPYIWTFNTHTYPWVLNLKKLDMNVKPQLYIRNGHNLMDISRDRTRTTVCTRLYPLGYGEGVNQLGIEDVNDGCPYLQSPKEFIDKYGIIERVWVDRRYENAESLKAAAQVMLNELQEPVVAYQASMADLIYNSADAAVEPGAMVRIIDTELGIDKTTVLTAVEVVHGDIQSSTITIANRSTDIASTVADLADRQRIEMTYSQGATQVYSQSLQENADSQNGLQMDFSIPNEMRIINKVLCKVRMESFRAYSKTTNTNEQKSYTSSAGGAESFTSSAGGAQSSTSMSGGEMSSTSSSGGGTNSTSSNGGGVSSTSSNGGGASTSTESGGGASKTTESGGGETKTSKAGGKFNKKTGTPQDVTSLKTGAASGSGSHTHTHGVGTHTHFMDVAGHTHDITFPAHSHQFSVPAHTHDFEVPAHNHSFSIPAHNHSFSVPAHSHSFNIPGHTHQFNVYNHTHEFTVRDHSHSFVIPGHSHNIEAGIFRFGSPKSFRVLVNGEVKATFTGSSAEIDLTEYLTDKNTGKIARGNWQSLEILPDDLAYIKVSLMVQGFVQSRGDAVV